MSESLNGFRAAVITVSTSKARGDGEDVSGPALAAFAEQLGLEVVSVEVIPDERELIAGRLRYWCDEGGCELVLTTGGTGFSIDDLTPEATRDVIEREAPGFAEAMRAAAVQITPHGMLSRGISGIAGYTLIINFPGSPKAVEEGFGVIAPTLRHVVRTLRGDSSHHATD